MLQQLCVSGEGTGTCANRVARASCRRLRRQASIVVARMAANGTNGVKAENGTYLLPVTSVGCVLGQREGLEGMLHH